MMSATPEARNAVKMAAAGIMLPSIAMLVNVVKMHSAGVKPPYIYDWKAAAKVPIQD